MSQVRYELSTDTLSIEGDLSEPLDIQFDIETEALIESAREHGLRDIFIDVRGLTGMGSQYIGALAAVAAEMKRHDGTLTVRAKDKVGELLCQCGLDRLMLLVVE